MNFFFCRKLINLTVFVVIRRQFSYHFQQVFCCVFFSRLKISRDWLKTQPIVVVVNFRLSGVVENVKGKRVEKKRLVNEPTFFMTSSSQKTFARVNEGVRENHLKFKARNYFDQIWAIWRITSASQTINLKSISRLKFCKSF